MKKTAEIIGRVLAWLQLRCPFCGAETVVNETMPWCVECRVEYYRSPRPDENGAARWVFNNKRKTPRFAFAKALNAVGGMRMSHTKKPAGEDHD